MRSFTTASIISVLSSFALAASTTSYDSSDYSSASSRALASDASLIYEFILDFNDNYNSYVSYMAANDMVLPTSIGNYFVGIQTINDESKLYEAIKTKDFPFSDFKTMVTGFTWVSGILSEAGVTTLYLPEDFLTGTVNAAADVSTSSVSSSGIQASSIASETSSTSSGASSSQGTSVSSSVSSSLSSSVSSSSSISSSSSNGVAGSALYIPVFSLPLLLGTILL